MANHYFQFKQFRVEQKHCAMKVSSDACIQGALAALHYNSPNTILDIGTGTGVLSLMLAKTFGNANITAIDIDKDAVRQANINFQNSKWNYRLNAQHIAIQDFYKQNNHQTFDAIISNPPFFSKHLWNASQQKTLARHDIGLSKVELAKTVVQLLSSNGKFCVMYPHHEWTNWMKIAKDYGLNIEKQFDIFPKTNKPANRVIAVMSRQKVKTIYQSFYIRKENGEYTENYNSLVADWYL